VGCASESLLPLQIFCTFTIAIGKGREPCFPVLRAQALSAFFFALPAPLRNVNPKCSLPEAIAVQGTFHFGSNFFLRWKTKERRFVLRKADAVRRKYGLSFQRFLSLFNPPQYSSDSHIGLSPSPGLSGSCIFRAWCTKNPLHHCFRKHSRPERPRSLRVAPQPDLVPMNAAGRWSSSP
jgi:hypothetical protein